MFWTIVTAGAVSVLVVAAVMLIILRFNQLSMARSLCDEAKRQLVVELRARHALVPAYLGTLQQVTTRDLAPLELALASAERAPFGPRGAAAENALTAEINDAAALPGRRAEATGGPDASTGMRDELDMTVQLLHGQLSVLSERIIAVSRLYNANVDRYHHQRRRTLSRLFGRVFTPREHFTEALADSAVPRATDTSVTRGTDRTVTRGTGTTASARDANSADQGPERGVVEA